MNRVSAELQAYTGWTDLLCYHRIIY